MRNEFSYLQNYVTLCNTCQNYKERAGNDSVWIAACIAIDKICELTNTKHFNELGGNIYSTQWKHTSNKIWQGPEKEIFPPAMLVPKRNRVNKGDKFLIRIKYYQATFISHILRPSQLIDYTHPGCITSALRQIFDRAVYDWFDDVVITITAIAGKHEELSGISIV